VKTLRKTRRLKEIEIDVSSCEECPYYDVNGKYCPVVDALILDAKTFHDNCPYEDVED